MDAYTFAHLLNTEANSKSSPIYWHKPIVVCLNGMFFNIDGIHWDEDEQMFIISSDGTKP